MGYGFVARRAFKAGLPKEDATTLRDEYAAHASAFKKSASLASKHVYLGPDEIEKREKADKLVAQKEKYVKAIVEKHKEKATVIIEHMNKSSKFSTNLKRLTIGFGIAVLGYLGFDSYMTLQTATKALARATLFQDLAILGAVLVVGGITAIHFHKQSGKAQEFAKKVDDIVPGSQKKLEEAAGKEPVEVGLPGARVVRS